MDCIVPGGVARRYRSRRPAKRCASKASACGRGRAAAQETSSTIIPGLQDRFIAAGRVAPELADRLGLCGLAGRASGVSWDLRVQFPPLPYDSLDVQMATHRNGDVGRARHRALRGDSGIDRVVLRTSSIACRGGEIAQQLARGARRQHRSGLGRRLARRGADRARNGGNDASCAACMHTIRPGRTGRCSSMR